MDRGAVEDLQARDEWSWKPLGLKGLLWRAYKHGYEGCGGPTSREWEGCGGPTSQRLKAAEDLQARSRKAAEDLQAQGTTQPSPHHRRPSIPSPFFRTRTSTSERALTEVILDIRDERSFSIVGL